MISKAQAEQRFARFRRLYYKGRGVPEEIEIEWMQDRSCLGLSVLDLDEPTIHLHENLRHFPRLFDVILLHEMSHHSLPKNTECHSGSRAWAREAMRLGRLGAMREFF